MLVSLLNSPYIIIHLVSIKFQRIVQTAADVRGNDNNDNGNKTASKWKKSERTENIVLVRSFMRLVGFHVLRVSTFSAVV